MKKLKKKILIAIGILVFLLMVGIGTSDVLIYTNTSGFISSSSRVYIANSKLKLKLPVIGDEIERGEAHEAQLQEAFDIVLSADPEFFHGKYNSLREMVFPIDDVIYYYRNDTYDKFYSYNKSLDVITEHPVSEYSEYAREQNKGNDIPNWGMHNYVVSTCIKAEGLLDYYGNLNSSLKSVDGIFYEWCIFYDKGRIFFEKNNTVYEYLPEKNKVSRIATVGEAESINEIYVK